MKETDTKAGKNPGTSKKGIDVKNLDRSVSPREDFYRYACGGWMENHPLTPEYSRYGTFDVLRENAREQLRSLIEGLKDTEEASVKGTIAQKISDIYEMGMDSERLNREGSAPLMPLLERIGNADSEKLTEILGWLHNGISSPFFSTGVGPDPADSDINIMHIGEAGLGLGDRDYYLEDNDENRRIMDAYHEYVVKIMKLAGYDDAGAERVWNNVINLETEFARHKMTREERRDPTKLYNIRTREEIKALWPFIDWESYFKHLGVDMPEKANVSSVGFMDFLSEFIPELSEEQIRDYLAFDVISDSTGVLSDDFRDASFELYGRVMSGKEEQEPRWKRAMSLPNSMLGEAVGQLYVAKYFPEENKEYMVGLVENLRKSLAKHISELSWMSAETKSKALEKLSMMKVKIGYPDKWKDYSGISIDTSKSYLENVLEASRWYANDNYGKLGKPVDKSEWHMTPQTVNAYYSPVSNEICFPAGILQPPYFDIEADDAVNYGAIGVVIGHEMTHGFDDQGRRFDKNGNLYEWWDSEDAEKFKSLADKLVLQFNEIEVAPGIHANGQFTLGENIADQGGLRVALTAYKESCENGELSCSVKDKIDDGFTRLQRFYLSYAGVWAGNIRREEILSRVKTDPHSLGEHRVNETLRNITPFLEAFYIEEGDGMYREEGKRVIIW